MRRLTPFLAAAGVLLLAFLAYRFLFAAAPADGDASAGPPGGGMPPTMVETVRARTQELPNSFETIGSLRAEESITLRPEVAGRIEKIHFIEGQQLPAGALMFSLDSALTRADLNEANANLQNTSRAYARASELAGKQLIAKADLDTRQAELAVNQARAASARTRLDKSVMRAPFSGVTGLRQVSVGDYVTAGQALVDLVRLDPIEIDLRAPEVVLSTLAVGQKVDFAVDSFRDERFTATVVAIAPTVDAGGRSVSLRARLENPGQKLRPGMSAKVRIELSQSKPALMIPEQAIWPNGDQKMVYLVVDGKAKLVPVTLGTRIPGLVEISSGIKPGDEVIIAGQLKLQDGSPVMPKPPEGKPAASTPAAAAAH